MVLLVGFPNSSHLLMSWDVKNILAGFNIKTPASPSMFPPYSLFCRSCYCYLEIFLCFLRMRCSSPHETSYIYKLAGVRKRTYPVRAAWCPIARRLSTAFFHLLGICLTSSVKVSFTTCTCRYGRLMPVAIVGIASLGANLKAYELPFYINTA